MSAPYDAVLFDLLSALLDSWTLWDDVAGDPSMGRQWRMEYLKETVKAGAYEPYLPLIAGSAQSVGLEPSLAVDLEHRWSELQPWPEARDVVSQLAGSLTVGIVTNCSEDLGQTAASAFLPNIQHVLTAERAGWYKPRREIYAQAIRALRVDPARILYVAGSPFDVIGAANAGLTVHWHDRLDLQDSAALEAATTWSASLSDLPTIVAG